MVGEHRQKLAVVGGGVAGIVSAHLLQKKFDVSLFEANNYVGGHTNTIVIPDGPDAGTPVDTGFIVLNDRNYPLFNRFLDQLNVARRRSDMSFSFYDENSGFHYAGTNLNGLLSQRLSLVRPRFWKLIREMARFHAEGRKFLVRDGSPDLTLGHFLRERQFDAFFLSNYILPMGSAIWSTSQDEMLEFPAKSFLEFFRNHGLLSFGDRPQWMTIVGGSFEYVKAFRRTFRGSTFTDRAIQKVRRTPSGVELVHAAGRSTFDHVVIATHADEALQLLENPLPLEERALRPWYYQKNATVLHWDESVLPPVRRAWASWNYTREVGQQSSDPASLTYHMNRLQGLETQRQYCVTLNRRREIPREKVVKEIQYEHPTYTLAAWRTQPLLRELNQAGPIHFVGSYFGNGFHEDAVRSAVELSDSLGCQL